VYAFNNRVRSASAPPVINVTPLINVLLVVDLARGAGVVTVGLVEDEG